MATKMNQNYIIVDDKRKKNPQKKIVRTSSHKCRFLLFVGTVFMFQAQWVKKENEKDNPFVLE